MYNLQNIIKKYIFYEKINETIDYFYKNKINNLIFVSESVIPLKFNNKNHIGGNKSDMDNSVFTDVIFKKDNNKYQIRMYKHIDNEDHNFKTINFIKIESVFEGNNGFSNGDHCGILIIDTKRNESNIQSVNNYRDCIKCYNDKQNIYKIGDILIQVMIYISINRKMKKINLHDNSYYHCNKYNIPLIILRTITYGAPFYTKYGFKPLNHNTKEEKEYSKNELQIYIDNKNLFMTKPTMTKRELLNIIYYTNFDKNKDKNMLNYINNIVIPRLKENNNLVSEFLKNILKDSKDPDEQTNFCDKSLINNKDNKENYKLYACKLLKNILMNLYFKCGYYDYIEKTFTLNLEDKEFTKSVKEHMKLKLI